MLGTDWPAVLANAGKWPLPSSKCHPCPPESDLFCLLFKTFYHELYSFFTRSLDRVGICLTILETEAFLLPHMGKLMPREDKPLPQCHRASKWQNLDPNSGCCTPIQALFRVPGCGFVPQNSLPVWA